MYQLRNDVWTSFKLVRDTTKGYEDRLAKLEAEVAALKAGGAAGAESS